MRLLVPESVFRVADLAGSTVNNYLENPDLRECFEYMERHIMWEFQLGSYQANRGPVSFSFSIPWLIVATTILNVDTNQTLLDNLFNEIVYHFLFNSNWENGAFLC